jgi:hypothetical protein
MVENQNTTEASEIKLDLKSKILFVVLGLFIVGSVAATYWRYIVKHDYIVESQIDCDPETENCFIWQCDPMSLEEGEACTGVPDDDIWYYKIFSRNAMNIPDCDPEDEDCLAYVCGIGEADCGEELCTPENVPDGEECNDPEQYLLENPPVEEECAEDDEECLAEQEAVECEEGDEECLSGLEENTEECSPDDEECLAEQEATECEEGDEECLAEEESLGENEAPAEAEEQGDLNQDNPGETNSGDQYIPPLGLEPN